ncbi:MAG: hypothetical protein GEU79_08010 [Acidimicrobiia bacterium]|nr:hypothetical protein [Acidimicrobiia bacterium]
MPLAAPVTTTTLSSNANRMLPIASAPLWPGSRIPIVYDAGNVIGETTTAAPLIRIGGYSPSTSVHSRAISHLVERMETRVGDAVKFDVVWNVMDEGRPATDLLDMVGRGDLACCYFSTSYLGARVPQLDLLERPFLFADLDEAHRALDGALGTELTMATEANTGFEVLGYWDNGFRHLTNRLRPVRTPDDLKGMQVRLQPNRLHAAMVEAWGATPVPTELSAGIEMITSLQVDAQENPLANTVAYGVDRVHHHLTMTGHLYGARGVYANPRILASLPTDIAEAFRLSVQEAILFQRGEAAAHETELRFRLESEGHQFVDLTPEERLSFSDPVSHLGRE